MADQNRLSIALEERSERGSRESRRLRRAGYVLGVIYGGTGQTEATPFKVNFRELRQVLSGGALFDAKVGDSKALPVIVKDQQIHPVRDEIVHIDLLEVRLDEKIEAPVAVELQGVEDAPGVKEGGVVDQVTRELNIEALPTEIPDSITVDVSAMEIAATMHLSEVTPPPGVTFLDDPEETIIATVVVPTEVEEPEVEEETELIGEDGEPIQAEGDEGTEGEAAGDEQPERVGEDSGGEDS